MSPLSPPEAFTRPGAHWRIEHFLGNDLVETLLSYVEANQSAFVPTTVTNTKGMCVNPNKRVSLGLRDFGVLRDALEERFRAVMNEAVETLRLKPFGLKRLEMELVAHGDGAFFHTHIDTQTGAADDKSFRALSAVLYFHTLPKGYQGGELRIHSLVPATEGGRFIDIIPGRDTLLLFPAWLPHEVLPVSCDSGDFMDSRFAINCWFRR
ncbi:2OG-Fe(II) oxygenase [Novosphingobium beihaiensis]|uniref:2OG-Fe(II) oxygenase n=1 Tax=Novosphingobium beihaiensis TaxID=2930389 RepID=A0ABT0BWA3_9SPHN|nr:2OG-Fe(II) oxygenase [Novosphingobium beihaiensis]MCJ2189233.1 2OG-Fe(II) oxygenase [Novosphingobium beihaiensis]